MSKNDAGASSPLAGKAVPRNLLIDTDALAKHYYGIFPELSDPAQRVSFGTSGHRGSSLKGSFTEAHVLAIAQAICDYRRLMHLDGPVFVGMDTHLLSALAQETVLEVLAGNSMDVKVQAGGGVTPTPVISHAILSFNKGRQEHFADGIIITPSHNPPEDGGIKYNPPTGGPADEAATGWIQDRANVLLEGGNQEVRRASLSGKAPSATDMITPYVEDLRQVVNMERIAEAGLRLAVDPLGGSSLPYWEPINAVYGLDIDIVNPVLDNTFSFMTLDHDGKIRMDCSSPWAMARLVELKERYDVAFASDPDADRHGIVTPSRGLLNPNHYLAVAIDYLLTHRSRWSPHAAVGKTLVSSSLIDRVVARAGRSLCEVPVGFKWFSPGLFDGSLCFGGEESAGASFLRRDGSVWTTDKDGLILGLLAAEITAVTGKDPGIYFNELTDSLGMPYFIRLDAPATAGEKSRLKALSPEDVQASELAGEAIVSKLTRAPGNGEPLGGLKVSTENGWFAARPSGTEDLYKIYAESFLSDAHLAVLVSEAQQIVSAALHG
ncbi:MAG TPA: phosphoglucomutase (alpha-D-glucose-1,6-bisphosphate-dependent) [Candidatus Hydrogenedentes bacterium]|jgi:phosphoglucomutase|nr:phosphoglucomutase (alpha-D-glucose-1,6-bisphosphate-dependent) [Candidatus Hydrogenedentota bacterium]HOR51826.1 phosphoglucomutase (alpha-D-glucose-1,6-bisphosphate-dependent) [Candidatus Hydrogenedentota bacterium]HPK24145.1 phosphoglucomutase (alpha-D-glucose-1,6-bisphosphate-dependent) [Candidatus Hydrogenedentota bacterium]HPX87438.1 phosphoglucomutase (alpha-D-glucose-1,6-bisphosphate-dependent) [Candidatus Hydrogenedentota bacterium]HQB03171.1 phosphoglucomutase (alpha-D-glucose-1,6-